MYYFDLHRKFKQYFTKHQMTCLSLPDSIINFQGQFTYRK